MSQHEEKRYPAHLNRIKLRDASCCPGLELIERICFRREPLEEDLAVLDAWAFHGSVVVEAVHG